MLPRVPKVAVLQLKKSRTMGTRRFHVPTILGCPGDLVSRIGNGPYGASYGLLWGLIGDTKRTY